MASELPAGSVTFLLTDIEGSTRLFRRLGDRYPDLLDRHEQLVRAAIAAHDGVEFKTQGDALLVAFASANDAFVAAVDAQRALRDEPWPSDVEIKVRMGIHTGIAFPRNGDYIALALHQAARIVGTASGGQTVASVDAVNAAGSLHGVAVRRLGTYRLRDFESPTELHQVDAPASIDDANGQPQFPALRAVPDDGHNLSPLRDTFVGRADELTELEVLVGSGELVTVVGPGGIGKTRLAVEYALGAATGWSDGVWMVDLAALAAGEPIGAAAAEAVGVAPGDDDPEEVVVDHLRNRQALLILDNCEHVLVGARAMVRRVLADCPGVGVLTTSRERLGLDGERAVIVSPLQSRSESVDLFIDRAQRRGAALPAEGADLALIADICERLDGLPLAIELAAARTNVLSPREILAGLGDHLAALRRRDETVAERQRTLRGLLDWSYDLLDPAEQAVFRRLSVFVGSFDLSTAAAAVAGDAVDAGDVAETIWSLADKSLLVVDQHEGSTRYRLLETVRAFATAYSEGAGDAVTTRRNLGERYLSDLPLDQRGNREWRMRLTLANPTIVQLVNRLVLDGELELAYALARISVEDVRGRTSTSDPTAFLVRLVDEQHQAANGSARLHITAAKLLADSGDVVAAAQHAAAAHDLRDRFGDHDRLGFVRLTPARSQLSLRDGSEHALRAAERELQDELDDGLPPSLRSDALVELSMVAQALDRDDPQQYLREAAVIAEQMDDHFLHMTVLNNLAEQELRDGDTPSAARHQREAMRLAAELGVQLVTAFGLVLAARIAQSEGLDVAAVRIHATAEVLLEECGFEMIPDDQVLSDAALDAARENLGVAAFDEAVAVGRGASLSDVLTEAEMVFDRAMEAVSHARHREPRVEMNGPGVGTCS